MGEVYRARDPRIGRDVAIKFSLKISRTMPIVSRDSAAKRRCWVRSIIHISVPFTALRKVPGSRPWCWSSLMGRRSPTSSRKGPIPLDEALPIAKQIADALEAAHEHGIIHRDLKPANIKLTQDGTVKVLDFGLAKASDGPANAGHYVQDLSASPTITSPAMTLGGVILGTAAYMSPEQAKGKPVDRRTDMWAFGCVLFEMLSGKRAFGGEDVSDTLAEILKSEPAWNALPPIDTSSGFEIDSSLSDERPQDAICRRRHGINGNRGCNRLAGRLRISSCCVPRPQVARARCVGDCGHQCCDGRVVCCHSVVAA